MCGQKRQSGRTPWRAASLCAERKALLGNAQLCLKRGLTNKKRIIENNIQNEDTDNWCTWLRRKQLGGGSEEGAYDLWS